MITLIIGGSKCGKSSLGEKILSGDFQGGKVYIATMEPYGEDASEAIERHKKMRRGKGFETVEKYTDIYELSLNTECGILLECMGNLCANEMFLNQEISDPTKKIFSGITRLKEYAAHLVIISGDVSRDGMEYASETQLYIKAMSDINSLIAEIADNVIECVYGIPVVLKGELPC